MRALKRVFVVGLTGSALDLPALQGDDGMCVVLLRTLDELNQAMERLQHAFAPSLVLVPIAGPADVAATAQAMTRLALAWVGLTPDENVALANLGHAAGATAMLPLTARPPVIARLVRRVLEHLDRAGGVARGGEYVERSFRAGEALAIAPGQAGIIRRGVLSLQGFDAEGAAVLIGFAGAGEAVLVAGVEFGSITYIGHTVGSIVVAPWEVAIQDPAFHQAQSARIASMEEWARAQADSRGEHRLLHALRLLARLAGRRHARGTYIDARITHAQLAAAVGVNRSTATRLLGVLKKQGAVLLVRDGINALRYCLPDAEPGSRRSAR